VSESTQAPRQRTTTPAEQQLAALRSFHTRVVHCTSTDVAEWRALAGPELRALTDQQLKYEVAWAWLRAWATAEGEARETAQSSAHRTLLDAMASDMPAWLHHLRTYPIADGNTDYQHERAASTARWYPLLRPDATI
jgi:hypothetical protein